MHRPKKVLLHRVPLSDRTVPGIMETRIEIFLFRLAFAETVYQSRLLCQNGKAILRLRNLRLKTGTLLTPFEIVSVRHYRFVQRRLHFLLANELVSYIPVWTHVSYTYMAAFLTDNPIDVGYPCRGLSWFNFDMFNHGF